LEIKEYGPSRIIFELQGSAIKGIRGILAEKIMMIRTIGYADPV